MISREQVDREVYFCQPLYAVRGDSLGVVADNRDRQRYSDSSYSRYDTECSTVDEGEMGVAPRRRSGRRRRRAFRRREESKNSWMKPEKFNGHGSFESFLYQFNNCASYNRWPETDKLAHLRWAMTGAAAQLLWGTEEMSFSELMEKLRCRFSGRGMEEKFQTELRCRRRGKGESLHELAQDIRRLMLLAYPSENSKLAEHLARDAFLNLSLIHIPSPRDRTRSRMPSSA